MGLCALARHILHTWGYQSGFPYLKAIIYQCRPLLKTLFLFNSLPPSLIPAVTFSPAFLYSSKMPSYPTLKGNKGGGRKPPHPPPPPPVDSSRAKQPVKNHTGIANQDANGKLGPPPSNRAGSDRS